MNEFWKEENGKSYPAIMENLEVDVCVIGGGLSGVLCAEEFLRRGKKVCILERNTICSGETKNSSAILTFAHDLVYHKLIKKFDTQKAKEFLSWQKFGMNKLVNLIKFYGVSCDLEKKDLILYATTKKGAKDILKEKKAYIALHEDFHGSFDLELPIKVKNSMVVKNQFVLNPFLFTTSLCEKIEKEGVRVFENSPVLTQPENGHLKVGEFSVKADAFVVCTHYPIFNFAGFFFAKMYQSLSHTTAMKGHLKNVYEGVENESPEFRQGKDAILCCGEDLRTGRKSGSSYRNVAQQAFNVFGEDTQKMISKTSAQDVMTFDHLPFVGNLSKNHPGIFIVTGFNKWGFSNAAASSKILADVICGKNAENPFDTKRVYFSHAPLVTLRNLFAILQNFSRFVFSSSHKKLEKIQNGQGAVVTIKGRKLAVYRDDDGALYTFKGLCPHMSCPLTFNRDDKTFDCPCHGSRFSRFGNLISAPSLFDLEEKKGVEEKD